MARPAKSAKVLTAKSQTKEEINARIHIENAVGGGSDRIFPPERLNEQQAEIFNSVVELMKGSDVLQNGDVEIIARYAFCLDRIISIENDVNEKQELMYDKDVLSAYSKFTQIYFRCCNELSLSPQSRAKLAIAGASGKNESLEAIKQIISGRDAAKG